MCLIVCINDFIKKIFLNGGNFIYCAARILRAESVCYFQLRWWTSHACQIKKLSKDPTLLHTSPGTLNSSTNFLWGNPLCSYILPIRTYRLNHLSAVGCLCWEPFVTGEKLWLDPGISIYLSSNNVKPLLGT